MLLSPAPAPPPESLARKVGVVVASRLLTTLVDLVTTVVIVWLLTKSELAVVSLLLVVYGTARYLATLGFPDSVLYFFEQIDPGARRQLVLRTCGLLLATGAGAALLILLLGAFAPLLLSDWTASEQAAVARYLPFVAFVSLLEIPTWPTTNVLLALNRQREAGRYEILTSLLSFAALLGPLALGYGVEMAVYGLLVYAIVRFVVSALWLWRVLPPTTAPLPPAFTQQQVRFSVPLGLNGAVNRLSKHLDRYVVSAMLPAAALAGYQVGGQEIPFVSAIPAAVGSVLVSRYVSHRMAGEDAALLGLWHRAIERTTLLVVPLTVFFIAAASDFITLVYGARFETAVWLFVIYNVILLHRVASYGSILQAYGDTRGILFITLSLLVTNAIVSFPLTYVFGIEGAALGTLLATAIGWVQALRRIGRHLHVPVRRVLPFPFYLRTLGVATVCGAVVYGLRGWVFPDLATLPALLGSFAVYGLLFVLLGALTGVLSPADWRRLRRPSR